MQLLGLKRWEFKLYRQALARSHWREVTIEVLNLSGKVLGTVTAPLIEGQVTVDVDAENDATLGLKLYDPRRRLGFDPAVAEYPVHRSRMLRVTDSRYVERLGRWVPCVVFTGPITDVDRTGAVVEVTAQDKSVLGMGEAWQTREFAKGASKNRVIRELADDMGETRMSVSKGKGTLGSRLVVKKMDKRWPKIVKVARSGGREAFYTGPGVLMVRRSPSRPQWTVPAAMVLSEVQIDRTGSENYNRFQVVGGKPKGKKSKRVVSRAYDLPSSHPDNPRPGTGVGRNGKLRVHAKVVTNDKIKSRLVANRRARQERDDVAKQAVDISVDIAPVPHLEPYDLVKVPTVDGTYLVRLRSFVLPLHPEGDPVMTLGYTRRVGAPTRGGKRKKTRKRRRGGAGSSGGSGGGGGGLSGSTRPTKKRRT